MLTRSKLRELNRVTILSLPIEVISLIAGELVGEDWTAVAVPSLRSLALSHPSWTDTALARLYKDLALFTKRDYKRLALSPALKRYRTRGIVLMVDLEEGFDDLGVWRAEFEEILIACPEVERLWLGGIEGVPRRILYQPYLANLKELILFYSFFNDLEDDHSSSSIPFQLSKLTIYLEPSISGILKEIATASLSTLVDLSLGAPGSEDEELSTPLSTFNASAPNLHTLRIQNITDFAPKPLVEFIQLATSLQHLEIEVEEEDNDFDDPTSPSDMMKEILGAVVVPKFELKLDIQRKYLTSDLIKSVRDSSTLEKISQIAFSAVSHLQLSEVVTEEDVRVFEEKGVQIGTSAPEIEKPLGEIPLESWWR